MQINSPMQYTVFKLYNRGPSLFFETLIAILYSFTAPPSFLNVHKRQVFVQGDSAEVECPALFGNPPLANMLWQKGSNRITTGGRYTAGHARLACNQTYRSGG